MTSAFGAQPLAAPRPHGRLNMSGRSTVVDSPGPGSFCTARADPARSAGAYQHLERGPRSRRASPTPAATGSPTSPVLQDDHIGVGVSGQLGSAGMAPAEPRGWLRHRSSAVQYDEIRTFR